ncbi:hypothetical protein BGZ61DRAFT_473558 [Ilyonectria robusta]|uniref:uncharacterized protein n=1 Tax=Ilyonectria robusta TaxID=1079257 RepID=UPI001E8E6ADE|nr:uncharacterized protein BGZ61DRAFT_473558 [Ilyonectria robusta]KAH8734884.1 hypothetical protein BGZ61DRAFT_473558 [Ilyonectria robusta]
MVSKSPRGPNWSCKRVFGTPVNDVPKLTELRKRLGCSSAGRRLDAHLYTIICEYSSKFTSSNGLTGHELSKWTDETHQAALLEISSQFLKRDGNGPRFWPSDPASPEYRRLQYSKSADAGLIKRHITQLFWRLGQQNPKPRPQTVGNRSDQTAAGQNNIQTTLERGQSPENPIYLDEPSLFVSPSPAFSPIIAPRATASTAAHPQPTPLSLQTFSEAPIDDLHMRGEQEGPTTVGSNARSRPMAPLAPMTEDLLDGPFASGIATTGAQSRRNGKRPVTQLESGHETSQAKRPRQQQCGPQISRDNHDDVDPFADFPTSSLFSPSRPRRPPQRDGYVTGEAFLRATSIDVESADEQCADDGSSPGSHLPTPPPGTRRQDTVGTVGRPDGGCFGEDIVSSIERPEERPSAAPTAPQERDQEPLGALTPEPEADEVLPPLSQEVPEPRPESGRERDLAVESDSSPKNVPQNAPCKALEPAAEHRIDPGVNSRPSRQGQSQLPKTSFTYSVMVSRGLNRTLNIQGGFKQNSLKDLLEKLPIRDIYFGLDFVLRTPKTRYVDYVLLGEEQKFKALKERFRGKVQEAVKDMYKDRPLEFEISIEPRWVEDDDVEDALDF